MTQFSVIGTRLSGENRDQRGPILSPPIRLTPARAKDMWDCTTEIPTSASVEPDLWNY
jgi:hypothetical protein